MKKRILFSFAHPDDESFTVGGIIAKYSKRQDIETIVYSATLGDAGKCGHPPVCSKEELPAVRKKELEQACEQLKVDHLETDTFLDGKLLDLPEGTLKDAVKKVIDQYKPEVVVTFPPHGISGHRDHTAIQQATFEAISESENTPVKRLYYVTVASTKPKTDKAPFVDDINDMDVITSYDNDEMEMVRQALKAHRTQHLSVERVFPTLDEKQFTKFGNREFFKLAWNQKGVNHSKSDDLF